jgi:poly(3-hydroxybutyrate) depolymerase
MSGSRSLLRSASCVLALCAAGPVRGAAPSLSAYNADIAQTSVSGLSSGAYMAVQFAVAWSSIVVGVGAIAGGPFACAEGSTAAALSTCILGTPPIDLAALIRRTDAWARSGGIDSTANLARTKVYVFSGYNDTVVARPVVNALQAFYAHYEGAEQRGNLFYQTAIGAGHAQVTLDYGGRCADNGGAYINHCGYDQAGIILQHIYGVLQPPDPGAPTGHLVRFDQREFTRPRQPADDSLADTGFAYVPQACAAMQPCRVHVALHGCLQSSGEIGQRFVEHAGYNAWADANRIIVLYPQTQAEALTADGGSNPQACWDWWGYLDRDPLDTPTYLLKSGRQIGAIKAMLDRLTGGARPSSGPTAPSPRPPATLRAVDASDSAIDLAWSAEPGAARYDVLRAGPGEPALRQVGSVAGLSYGDAGLQPATAYRYQVRVSSPVAGPLSAEVLQATRRAVPVCRQPGGCAVR